MILVIKLSGKVLEEKTACLRICRQIAVLGQGGHRLVVVHGGGKQLTELSSRLGIPVVQYEGRRVTDPATLEVAKMVLSAINRELTATLLASGVSALGMAGFDGHLVRCRRREPIPVQANGQTRVIDFGLVGRIEQVNTAFLAQLWGQGLVPVVSCLCADASGQILNVNADTLAAELAAALAADRLISVSDVEGVYFDPSDPVTKITELDAEQARELLEQGRVREGMIPKMQTALKALERGVTSVQIVGQGAEDALCKAVQGEAGTVIWGSQSVTRRLPVAALSSQKAEEGV